MAEQLNNHAVEAKVMMLTQRVKRSIARASECSAIKP